MATTFPRDTTRAYVTTSTTVNDRDQSSEVAALVAAETTSRGISDLSTQELLSLLYLEHRKTNAYLAELVGSTLTDSDLEP